MSNKISNPLYDQFIDLVSAASTEVINNCVIPLNASFEEAQLEINKIEGYVHDLEKQYIEVERIVSLTTEQILNNTIHPIIENLEGIEPKLSQAATTIISVQDNIKALQAQTNLIKTKHENVAYLVKDVSKKVLTETIDPIQQELKKTLPELQQAKESFDKIKKLSDDLNITAEEISNYQKQFIRNSDVLQQNILDTKVQLTDSFYSKINEQNEAIRLLSVKIENLEKKNQQHFDTQLQKNTEQIEIFKQKIEKNLEDLNQRNEISKKSIVNQIDVKNTELSQRLEMQKFYAWGIIALLACILYFK